MKSWITPDDALAAIREGRGRGVRIAILDSGVEASHPALGGSDAVFQWFCNIF